MRYIPARESMPKVSGNRIAMAKITFRPGIVPMMVPAAMPTFIIKIFSIVKISFKTSMLISAYPFFTELRPAG